MDNCINNVIYVIDFLNLIWVENFKKGFDVLVYFIERVSFKIFYVVVNFVMEVIVLIFKFIFYNEMIVLLLIVKWKVGFINI